MIWAFASTENAHWAATRIPTSTFSADSNHLFWVKNSAGRFRLFVDGKPVFESGAPSFQTLPKETFQTNGPSGLLVLAHDNEGYKRISITPSPESSLATIR
jgi:hypothetical protein